MWSREFRAGVFFVVASLLVGSAARSYRSRHEARFSDLIASLEESGPDEPPAGTLADSSAPPSPARRGLAPEASRGERPVPDVSVPLGSIDLNRASARELETLPGIGPALAARIVGDRSRRGPFANPDSLLRVSGVGPRILARVRPFLVGPARLDSAR